MRKKIILCITAIIICLFSITAVVMAQSSSNFDLSWRTLSGGGDQQRSANFIVEESVGQMAAGTITSANHEIVTGFIQSFVAPDDNEEEDKGASFIPFVAK